jgi:hypothetical protein
MNMYMILSRRIHVFRSSAIASAAASYITSPLDLVKLRLQIETIGDESKMTVVGKTAQVHETIQSWSELMQRTFLKIYEEEGIRGLFRGASVRVLFHTPSAAMTMGLFEVWKSLLKSDDMQEMI